MRNRIGGGVWGRRVCEEGVSEGILWGGEPNLARHPVGAILSKAQRG